MNPYTILGGLALVIAAYFGGIHVGKKLDHEAWQKEKIALQDQRLADIQTEVDKRTRDQLFNQAKARKATEDHEKALASVSANYEQQLAAVRRAGGLRIPASVCRAASAAQSAGASGPDEAGPATVELPERTQESLFNLTKRADELAEQLRALQEWVRDNGFYGDGIPHP